MPAIGASPIVGVTLLAHYILRMYPFARGRVALTAISAVVALACADSTAPNSTTRSAKHSLIGVYDVTTVLDSFSFEGVGSRCPTFAPSCMLIRASSGGLLEGTLTIGDSVIVIDTIFPGVGIPPLPVRDTVLYELPIVRANFVGRACANIDFVGSTGCTALADSLRADYSLLYGPIITGSAPSEQRRFTVTVLSLSDPQRVLTFTSTRGAGDTIWGRLSWQTEPGRQPPTFYGAFRAIQRR